MSLEYTYDFVATKYRLTIPPEVARDGLIELKTLVELLVQDGACVDARSVLSYLNSDCDCFCKINPGEVIELRDLLRVKIRTPPDRVSSALYERIERLEVCVNQLQRRLEQLEEPVMQKISPLNSLKENRQDIDIFMLHASPLVEKKSGKPEISLDASTLNFEVERRLLLSTLENNGLGASLRFEAATNENLCEALSFAPKVLHISCHGNYDDHKKFYLAFEASNTLGMLDKLSKERLKKLLETKPASPSLVFVSACFSEAITQVYLEAGFKCVVAVQSDCKIHDEAANAFAREFYLNLLRGESIRKAFEGAKVLTKYTAKSISTCCCAHTHKEGCKWYHDSRKDSKKAHRVHTPDCSCPEARLGRHRLSCDWAKFFLSEFNPSGVKESSLIACCCSPELPHNEGQKFVLLSLDPVYETQVLFPNWSRTEIEVFNAPIEDLRPPNVLNDVLRRNVEIKNLVQLLAGTGKHRCISVFGVKGVGKSQLVKKAVIYAYERHVFKHGVVYLDFRGKTDVSRIYSRIANKLMMPGVSKKAQLVRAISPLSLCIVIDNLDSLFVEDIEALTVKVNHLLEQTTYAKFVIVTELPLRDSFVTNFEVKAMDSKNAGYLLRYMTAGSSYSIKDRQKLRDNPEILNSVTKTPSVLLQLATQLKQGKQLRELLAEFSQPESQQSQRSIMEKSMEKLTLYDSRYRELIIYLSCFPSGFFAANLGLLEEGLQDVFENMVAFTSSNKNSWVVNIEQHNALRKDTQAQEDTFYTLRDDVRSFVLENYAPRESHLAATLDHLASLARSFLRDLSQRKLNLDIHLYHFSAILDSGMWRAAFPVLRVEMDLGHFKQLEYNFLYYIDPKRLQCELSEHCSSLRFFTAFKELTLCTVALLTTLEDLKSAQVVLKKAEHVCMLFSKDLHFQSLLAQIRLVKTWLRIIAMKNTEGGGVPCKSVDKSLNRLYDVFQDNPEGNAERCFLAGLHKKHNNGALCMMSGLNKSAGQWFDDAATNFRAAHNVVGEARAVLEREHWRIKQGLSEESTSTALKEAQAVFQSRGLQPLANEVSILRCTCLVQTNSLSKAKKKTDRLLKSSLNERQKATVSDLQAQISERLTKDSLHKFVFLRAYPLVCKDRLNERLLAVGNLCRLSMNYRRRLEKDLKKTEMYVCLRFNIASAKNLKRYVEEGCRILQLSSEVHDADNFMLEKRSGECAPLPYTELAAQIVKDAHSHQIEVIVLAMPGSKKGAKDLVDGKAAKFTVGFDFPQYSGEVFSLLCAYENAIQLFCSKFYAKLQKGVTVQDAFSNATFKMDEYLEEHSAQLNLVLSVDKPDVYPGEGPVLYECTGVDAKTECFQGLSAGPPIIDIPEASFNSYCSNKTECLVGRQLEMHECITGLKELRCVQVVGQDGTGKTVFVYHVAKYLSKRNLYRGGIYVYNFQKKSVREAESHLTDTGLFRKVDNDLVLQVRSGRVLLVLDDCNELAKQETTFEPWLQNLMRNEMLSLLLVKRIARASSEGQYTKIVTLHSLQNPRDSAALLLTFLGSNPDIFRSRVPGKHIIHQLTESSLLIQQRGIPRNIETYADNIASKVARSLSTSPRSRVDSFAGEEHFSEAWAQNSSAGLWSSLLGEESKQNFETFELPILVRQNSESMHSMQDTATPAISGFSDEQSSIDESPTVKNRKKPPPKPKLVKLRKKKSKVSRGS